MQNWVDKPALKRAVEDAQRETRSGGTEPGHAAGLPPATVSPAFLPVHVAEATAGHPRPDRPGVEIVLAAGRRVVVGPGFDRETLRRVIAVLEDRSC